MTLRRDGDRVVLCVRDTGIGIPAHEIPRLFDRFHRVAGAGGRTHEGSGIGLALVQELVRLHGGTVRVDSVFGAGSVFALTIPLGTAHLPADRIAAAAPPAAAALAAQPYVEEAQRWLPDEARSAAPDTVREPEFLPEPQQPAPPAERAAGERATILLADDNADMRDYMRRLLGAHYAVRAVADGEAALAAARASRPDLILSDVMMPRLDGFGLLRAVRADPALADLPVMLVSARAGEEASIEGLEAGADDYLIKPFGARELLARVRANLEMARLRREADHALRQAFQETAEVLESIDDAFFAVDRDWRITYVNRHTERLWAMRRDDLLGRGLWDIFTQAVGSPIGQAMHRAMRERQVVECEAMSAVTGGWLRGTFYPSRRGLSAYLRDITERKQADEALHKTRAQLQALFDDAPLGAYLLDGDFRFRLVNPTARPVFGEIADLIGRDFSEVIHTIWPKPYADELVRRFRHTLETGEPHIEPEHVERRLDRGVTEYYEWQVNRVVLPEGRHGVVCYFRDISAQVLARRALAASEERLRGLNDTLERKVEERTRALVAEIGERRKVEAVLHQAQRLDAIGRLTGGVAHDFNNLLTVVIGQAESIIMAAGGNERIVRMATAALRVAEGGARLTSQLLAFSRRQFLRPESVVVRRLMAAIAELVRRAVGEAITVEIGADPELWPSLLDAAQFEAAILNLAVNARDAMPDGGRLTIEMRNAVVGTAEAPHLDLAPGDYVLVSVSDTGCGMPPEVRQQCFEPFFTTKDVGRGTGLGLSQVYGFTRQSGGTATVASAVGRGTTIALYLPRASHEPAADAAVPAEPDVAAGHGETVLVVEDQEEVREVIATSLRQLGYRIHAAPDGSAARTLLESDEPIDLLLTDIVMPNGANGVELARWARRLRQDLKIVLVSGYSRQMQPQGGESEFVLLEKPFRRGDLAATVAAALAGTAR